MITIQSKDFSKRSELENKIRNLTGLTVDLKSNYEIHGTQDELERLQLSDRNIFWGIKIIITDTPTKNKTQSEVKKPQRGEIKTSGLNNNFRI